MSSSLRFLSTISRPESNGRLESAGRLRARPNIKADQAEKPSKTKPAEQAEDELDLSAEAKSVDGELTPEQRKQVDELKARDREVRTHEQAHKAAAGPYARGGPTYDYQLGPDGQRYAIGGEVQIDTAPVPGDPEATIQKARVVRAAALAPAEPSSQDRAVAAAATKLEQQAIAESREKANDTNEADHDQGTDSNTIQSTSVDPPEGTSIDPTGETQVASTTETEPTSQPSSAKAKDPFTQAIAKQQQALQASILDLLA